MDRLLKSIGTTSFGPVPEKRVNGERKKADGNEGRLQFSTHPLRGSSLVSIRPSTFTTGGASSDPGRVAN